MKNTIRLLNFQTIKSGVWGIFLVIFFIFAGFVSCTNEAGGEIEKISDKPKGKLFIIGGGKRSPALIDSLLQIAEITDDKYIVVLPMASEWIDTASYYSSKQFTDLGVKNVFAMNFGNYEAMTKERTDSVKNADLIYISGGDQNRFMKIVAGSPVENAIKEAYKSGATIAGTSAGAAVMSKKMITGNELKAESLMGEKYKEYTGEYRNIRANNIEIGNGLGLVNSLIIDQHFIWRMRMNRLITTCLENPLETAVGIDESTAILVAGNKAKVFGESQVISLKHKSAETRIHQGLLGGENLELSIYLPGEEFEIENYK